MPKTRKYPTSQHVFITIPALSLGLATHWQVPKQFVEEDRSGVSASTRLAAAAGFASAGLQMAASSAQSGTLVPGDGDPISWRNYIGGFQGAKRSPQLSLLNSWWLILCLLILLVG